MRTGNDPKKWMTAAKTCRTNAQAARIEHFGKNPRED